MDLPKWDDQTLHEELRLLHWVKRMFLFEESGVFGITTGALRYGSPEKYPEHYGCSVQGVDLQPSGPLHRNERFSWNEYCAAVFHTGLVRTPENSEQIAGVIRDPSDDEPTHCLIRIRDEKQRKRLWEPIRARIIEHCRGKLLMTEAQANEALFPSSTE